MRSMFVSPHRLRHILQVIFFAACLYVGWSFFCFHLWMTGASSYAVPRPAGVEAFLPISALLGLRNLFATGMWDPIHPAGLTVLVAAISIAILFRKGFCAVICPIGFLSNKLQALGAGFGIHLTPPRLMDLSLRSIKYILALFFVYTTFFGMTLSDVQAFIRSPYNMVADSKLLLFFLQPSPLALCIIISLAALSVAIPNFWCRYLCPYGAFLGVFSLASPLAIHREAEKCIECGKCTKACPGGIQVHRKFRVNHPDCIGCAECIGTCPVENCLSMKVGGRIGFNWRYALVGVALLYAGWYSAALWFGIWQSQIPPMMLMRFYSTLL